MLGRMQEAFAEKSEGAYGVPHGGTIGEDYKDSISGGDQIGTGISGAKEMDTADRVGNGAMGRMVWNERSN